MHSSHRKVPSNTDLYREIGETQVNIFSINQGLFFFVTIFLLVQASGQILVSTALDVVVWCAKTFCQKVWEKYWFADDDMYYSRESYPSLSSFSSPLTSGSFETFSTSSVLIRSCKLQNPRHRSAWVDWTDRWDRTWERMRWPQLKRCSTSMEVAVTNRQQK